MTQTSDIQTSSTASSFLIGGNVPVRRLGFGAMRLTNAGGDGIWRGPADPAAAVAVLRRAVELGVQHIDTADSYALGANEELVAQALHPYADDVLIATKIGNTRPGPDEWVPLGHPAYLRQQAELSLRRLRVERLDLLYLHRVDPAVPLDDQIGALAQLQQEGKVGHIGLSEVSVDEIQQAQQIAPIAAVQNLYNFSTRDHEAVLEYTASTGIAFVPFFPVGAGEHAKQDGVLADIAREVGATPAQVALAWLLHRADHVLPIPGTTSLDHLADNVAAAQLRLTPDQLARL
ncbi:aldo/keto reductase [Kribbella sp. NPDC058245]|uniref:aldo/keto reductase n=1 Tax=Kribbella sp. NPDC058245 TaxID=3346399 RepID=UPI0036ECB93D